MSNSRGGDKGQLLRSYSFGAILQYCRVWRYTLRTRMCLALYCNAVGFGAELYGLVFDWRLVRIETVSAAGACLYKHGPPLSGICSSFWLGFGPYGVGRQCYSLVRISRQTRQLALAFINTGARCRVSAVVFGWALIRTESGASATAWYLSRDRLGSWSLPL